MNDFNEYKIPDDYRKIPSKLSGIDVYGPNSDKPAKPTKKSYKCPECGANTHFDVAAAGIACEHCGHTAIVKPDPGVLTEAHHEFTLKTLPTANQVWGVERKHMLCESCGVEFSITEDSITSSCPFCAANKVHISPAPVEFLRPEFIIPFKISPELQQTFVNKWLRQGWFHPSNMACNRPAPCARDWFGASCFSRPDAWSGEHRNVNPGNRFVSDGQRMESHHV